MQDVLEDRLIELPDVPGIYLFYTKKKELVYVGKASSLKNRVRSYWRGKRTSRPIEQMMHEVSNVRWVETDSALEAAILESVYIKKHLPRYNVDGKDDKSWNYFLLTKDAYPRLLTLREHEMQQLPETQSREEKKQQRQWKMRRKTIRAKSEIRAEFGPYPGLNTKEAMKILRRLFLYSDCEPLVGRPCLYRQMGQCLGVCTGEISATDYRARVIRPLILFLKGEKKRLVSTLEKSMHTAAKKEDFEEAARLREQLKALYRIHDIALLNSSFVEEAHETEPGIPVRIEGYDISNLGSTGIVGSMVVFSRGLPDKKEYRKFAMRTTTSQSDVDSLKEMLGRRLGHSEWRFPDAILIDGGRPQVSAALTVLRERGLAIPLVGIAKGPERKRNDFLFPTTEESNLSVEVYRAFVHFVSENENLFIRVRDEAHRFAITFQRSKRRL